MKCSQEYLEKVHQIATKHVKGWPCKISERLYTSLCTYQELRLILLTAFIPLIVWALSSVTRMKFKEKQIPAIPVQVCPKNSEHCNVQNLQLSAKKFLHVQWLEEKGRHRQKYKTRVKTNPTCLVIKSTGFGNDIIKSMQSGNEINRFRRLHPKAWKLR